MPWPWRPAEPAAEPTPITADLLERSRRVRERADAVVTLLLPAIDPNETFAPDPEPAREEPAWSA